MAVDLQGEKVKAGRIADARIVKNVINSDDAVLGAVRDDDEFFYALRVQLPSGKEYPVLLTQLELAKAIQRAQNNPEDVPHVSHIREMFD